MIPPAARTSKESTPVILSEYEPGCALELYINASAESRGVHPIMTPNPSATAQQAIAKQARPAIWLSKIVDFAAEPSLGRYEK